MNPQERTKIVEILEKSREQFNATVGAISEAQSTLKPDPARWSVLECVEHVATAEGMFLGWLEGAQRMDAPRVDPQREAELAASVANRSTRAQAPERVQPAGRFATLAEALAQFNSNRDRTIRYAQERSADLYHLAAEHPRLGALNGVELLIITAGHPLRHAEQIREIPLS